MVQGQKPYAKPEISQTIIPEQPTPAVVEALIPVGTVILEAHDKLEKDYPGWAQVLQTIYDMFETGLGVKE